jgi:hypothetical protein
MRKLLPLCSAAFFIFFAIPAVAEESSWVVIATKDGMPALWIQPSSYESINPDSFRLRSKLRHPSNGVEYEGKIDVNCRNKDYWWKPDSVFGAEWFGRGNWKTVVTGTPTYLIGIIYCKRTLAAQSWGYTGDTAFLWDQTVPTVSAGDAKGDWVLVGNNDKVEHYYNKTVINKGDFIQVAVRMRLRSGDQIDAGPSERNVYNWLNVSCKSNYYSELSALRQGIPSFWLAPKQDSGGLVSAVRKAFCL